MTQAWIGFAGGLVAVLVSALVAVRQARTDERLARLNSDLDVERHERQALFDRGLDAEAVLAQYREPLAAAAFDLQSRLYNILEKDFLDKFGGSHARAEEATRSTAFRLAQYFGWTELLRRDIQFLNFPAAQDTRAVAELRARIARCFLSFDDYGPALMIWSDAQRAIGERMIVEAHGKVLCMGYASFDAACEDTFAPLCARVRDELAGAAESGRLRNAQHLLCELVETLDSRRVRYAPDQLTRA